MTITMIMVIGYVMNIIKMRMITLTVVEVSHLLNTMTL